MLPENAYHYEKQNSTSTAKGGEPDQYVIAVRGNEIANQLREGVRASNDVQWRSQQEGEYDKVNSAMSSHV